MRGAKLKAATPAGTTAYLTGRDPLVFASSKKASSGPSVLTESLIGGLGALIILLFVFGTMPAVLMPILAAAASILTTFIFIWALTYITSVSIIVQFLVALVGLGVAIDYSLLMIFRFREELKRQPDVETALVETMTHAGHSVIVSGTTVAVGLLSMVILPLPFIRSIGIGGMLIPAVSVLRDHAAAGAAVGARREDQQRAGAAQAPRRAPRTALGPLGPLRHAAAVPRGRAGVAIVAVLVSGSSSTRARRRRRTSPARATRSTAAWRSPLRASRRA